MRSVTCGDGRSVLPTSIASGSPAEARGGVVGVDGYWGRSEGVAGAPRKVQGELIALSPSLLPICKKMGPTGLFPLFCRCGSLNGLVLSPGLRGGLRKVEERSEEAWEC